MNGMEPWRIPIEMDRAASAADRAYQLAKEQEVMAKLTNQELFDKVWNGLKSQGFQRSTGEDGVCLYRGPGGRRCAAGWVIPDEMYSGDMEFHGLGAFDPAPVLKPVMELIEDRQLLIDLQRDHDGGHNPEDMEANLRWTAEIYELTVPE